jgi:hypothetical protein
MADRTVNLWELDIVAYENTPEATWKHAQAYFMWCDTHAIMKPEMIKNGGAAGKVVYTPIPRPYTIKGFSLFTGISEQFMKEMAANDKNGDWHFVCKRILDCIHVQKLENVIAGVYSAVVVVKEIGLGENKHMEGNQEVIIQVDGTAPKLISNEKEVDLKKEKYETAFEKDAEQK